MFSTQFFAFRSTNRGSALESSALGSLLVDPLHRASAGLLLRTDFALRSLLGDTLRRRRHALGFW
jgi:hypothetical protein